jgi:hypothetical protein
MHHNILMHLKKFGLHCQMFTLQMGVANMQEIQILEFGYILEEHMLQHGRAQVVSLSSFGCSQNLKISLFPIAN